MKKKITPKQYI